MRRLWHWTLAVCVVSGVLVATQGADATKTLTAAREALGGEKKLSAVKTFVASGRTRQLRGDNLVPIEFEINCELPDKYVRKDEVPAQENGPTSSGFSGEDLIQQPPPSAPPPMPAAPARPGGPPPPDPAAQLAAARKTRVLAIKQDFAKLTLGMFAASFSAMPLTFTYAAEAEAPQGKADVIDVKGPGNFAAKLFINATTHLPIMVSWQTPTTNIVPVVKGQPPPTSMPPGAVAMEVPPAPAVTATQTEKDAYLKAVADARKIAQAKPTENRLYYADYRDVDGVQFPFRLRRAIGADTVEETIFDRFKLNAKIDPKKFEIVK